MLSISTIGFCAWIEVLAIEAEGAAEQGLFSGTFADALWTVLAFVVLMVVLGRLAWKPMLERLKARELYIQQQIEAANDARQQALNLLDQYKQQRTKILKDATDEALQRQQELLEKAGQEILAIKQEAKEDIGYARARALEQLWDEAGEMVLALSREVLGREVTHDDNKHLIRDAIEQIRRDSANSVRQQTDGDKPL
jgi:F-type H+-transporting ATPase subunit b